MVALDDEILKLCVALWLEELPPLEGIDNDYRLLVNEVMRQGGREQTPSS